MASTAPCLMPLCTYTPPHPTAMTCPVRQPVSPSLTSQPAAFTLGLAQELAGGGEQQSWSGWVEEGSR